VRNVLTVVPGSNFTNGIDGITIVCHCSVQIDFAMGPSPVQRFKKKLEDPVFHNYKLKHFRKPEAFVSLKVTALN
jgi:hypothetical protein